MLKEVLQICYTKKDKDEQILIDKNSNKYEEVLRGVEQFLADTQARDIVYTHTFRDLPAELELESTENIFDVKTKS